MTLHLEQLYDEIVAMNASASAGERLDWLARARELLVRYNPQRLDDALARNRALDRPKLAPRPIGPMATRIPPPTVPATHTVIAADGSAIPPERNGPARFYVLNIGLVTIRYGDEPEATIRAQAELGHTVGALNWGGEPGERPVDERRLGQLMRIREIEALADSVEQLGYPAVALVDGQLVMWTLQAEQREDREWLMSHFTAAMARLHEYGIPIVGYISDTESFELINALRLYLCPSLDHPCVQCGTGTEERALCGQMRRFRDPTLLFGHLRAGERTGLFESEASILKEYDAAHRICYFFMHTGDEIARVEVPRWVADDPQSLELVHSVLWDQCQRCLTLPPYPPALHEAHEAAVITHAERESVNRLIEEQLQRDGQYAFRPAKSWHKRRRGV